MKSNKTLLSALLVFLGLAVFIGGGFLSEATDFLFVTIVGYILAIGGIVSIIIGALIYYFFVFR